MAKSHPCAVHKRYLEEASSSNVFLVKGGVIATPATTGTILLLAPELAADEHEERTRCGHEKLK
jgi:hypothetical protein